MRRDIEIHINTGDVAVDPQNKYKLRDFKWVEIASEELAELSRYIYGEIEVPYVLSDKTIRANGLYVTIPYTPIYKEFKVRVRRVREDGSGVYLTNYTDGTNWFVARAAKYGRNLQNLFASALLEISEDAFFIDFSEGDARVYSSNRSDFNIINADRQNANCLLACVPGGNYRYPLTGVGLIRWANSTSIKSTGLTKVLQEQFEADGVTVKEAAYNFDTMQMELDLDTQESED